MLLLNIAELKELFLMRDAQFFSFIWAIRFENVEVKAFLTLCQSAPFDSNNKTFYPYFLFPFSLQLKLFCNRQTIFVLLSFSFFMPSHTFCMGFCKYVPGDEFARSAKNSILKMNTDVAL